MLKNYIKITLRNIYKNKLFSLINILGLAAGIACTILILLFVQDELSYDQFHSKKNRIVRVTREWLNQDGESSLHLARVAPPIGTLIQNDYSQMIESMVRIAQDYRTKLKYNNDVFIEEKFYWAEKDLFNIFDFHLIKGNKETALSQPNSVVISETTAQRLFGNENPIGKVINYEGQRDLAVTGVVKDAPQNSHFKFDYLASFITLYEINGVEFFQTNWGSNNYATYFLLKNENLKSELQAQMPAFIDKHLTQVIRNFTGQDPAFQPSKFNIIHVQSLTDIHLHSHLNSEFEQNGDITNIYLFSAIAVFILLIACINFMNLATAKSSKRAKEIGMRKVLGAEKKQLVYQFIGESLFISFLSLMISIGIVEAALPSLNNFIGKELAVNYFDNPIALLGIILITLFVGLISGSYPAFLLSSFKPVSVLKGNNQKGSGRSLFRTVLVVSQFTISIVLIISMTVVYNQMEFFRNKKLGFNKDQLVILPAGERMLENIDGFKSILLQNPNIKSVAASDLIPSDKLLNNWGAKRYEGNSSVPLDFRLAVVQVDYDFVETYQFEIASGRNFSREYASDDSNSYILNEAAAKRLGWSPQDAVGKPLEYGNVPGTVIGVLKDFNFESLHNEITPVVFVYNRFGMGNFTVRVAGDKPGAIDFLKGIWEQYNPDYPFEYSFLNNDFEALYASEEQLGEIFGVFAFLAVFIACLGLFGLASFAAEQKTKEIGIRKVLGATVTNIVSRFTFEFVKLILIANIIAWPLAYYAMNTWLDTFAYKTDLALSTFISAGFIALIIAVATISFQAVKASLTNPAKTLKYE
ncbi:MAG: FtsX-like permease family protein [Melioribacteraceae bacterium]|nr:MAG: FtsX-like permease family protein [Melioribacteraceae bacterium]